MHQEVESNGNIGIMCTRKLHARDLVLFGEVEVEPVSMISR